MQITPTKRRDLVRNLRALGFVGPSAGGKHPLMSRGNLDVHIPNEHAQDVSAELLRRILRNAGILDEYERL
ncbi:MAG TPA: type II toxin-antitoxin system HicA family toxin [Chloroflexota bacterium]|nr:type II toxin-antitoxin system HicA family toxin [Chloroflexota bacterium]